MYVQIGKTTDERGFSMGLVLAGIGVFFLLAIIAYMVVARTSSDAKPANTTPQTLTPELPTETASTKQVAWTPDAAGAWKPAETPPVCPVQPMMQAPVNTAGLTLVDYPGQPREGAYRTVSTLLFTGISPDTINVNAPMDAVVQRGAKYVMNGETQYAFDFVNSCGIMYRLAHLRVLSSALAAIAGSLSTTTDQEQKLTPITDGPLIKAGDRLATGVGLVGGGPGGRPIVDFGVYDLRLPNKGSDPNYVKQYGMDPAGYGVCWFDWIGTTDADKVRSVAGYNQLNNVKKNDFCPLR